MDRRKYIGSSDARDILMGNWMPLWSFKTGRSEPIKQTFKMAMGAALEDFHLDWIFEQDREPKLEGWVEEDVVYGRQHRAVAKTDIPIPVISHLDAVLVKSIDTPGLYAPVEVKHTCRWANVEQAMEWYMPQLQHHLWTSGAPALYFSVIIGNDDPQGAWVGRSEDWIKLYAEKVAEFCRYVVEDRAPPSDVAESSPITPNIRNAIPIDNKVVRDLTGTNEMPALALDYIENEAAAKRFDDAKKGIKTLMQDTDREVYCVVTPGDVPIRVTAKKDKRNAVRISYDTEAESAA